MVNWHERPYVEWDNETNEIKKEFRSWWLILNPISVVLTLNVRIIEFPDDSLDEHNMFTLPSYDLSINGVYGNWQIKHKTLESAQKETIKALKQFTKECELIVENYQQLCEKT